MSHVMHTYKRLPVTFERGEGCWLWDTQGKRYLDALAGIAVCGVGHSHPRLVKTIAEINPVVPTPFNIGVATVQQGEGTGQQQPVGPTS